MTLTSPSSISNSSSKPFSNLFGRIAKDNLNKIEASQSSYEFNLKNKIKINKNKYPQYKPLNTNEVLISTNLLCLNNMK